MLHRVSDLEGSCGRGNEHSVSIKGGRGLSQGEDEENEKLVRLRVLRAQIRRNEVRNKIV